MASPIKISDTSETVKSAYTKSLKFLTFRPRSEKEMVDHLSKKGFEEDIISSVLELLRKQKLIDDTEFVKWWIEQRQEFKAKSKFIIKQELLQKGLDRNIIDSVLEKTQDDFETAKGFFEKHKHRFERYNGEEYQKKVYNYLSQRGFSWEIIDKIIKNQK